MNRVSVSSVFSENSTGVDRKITDEQIEVVRADWAPFSSLRHGFSMRHGGVSEAYGGRTLNLGWTKEDAPSAVAENRRRLVRAVAGNDGLSAGERLVTVRQVHSTTVCVIRRQDGPFHGVDGRALLEGDGLMTDVPGLLLGVGTADCVPVLVADVRLRVVAAFHAGWRGTVERIVEKGIGTMGEVYGSRAEDLVAAIGPSIGSCCYGVGEEVRRRFEEQFAYAAELFDERDAGTSASSGQGGGMGRGVFLDLWEANRRQLLDAGVGPGRISVLGECTACSREADGARRYFSHRAEKGVTGRMLSVVGICEMGTGR